MNKREVEISCPSCRSGYHHLIRMSQNLFTYQCSCGKRFRAKFDRICIACELLED